MVLVINTWGHDNQGERNYFTVQTLTEYYSIDLRLLVEMEIETTPIPKRLSDSQEVARLLE